MSSHLKTLLLPALILAAASAAWAGSYSVRNDSGSDAIFFVDNWVHSAQFVAPGKTANFKSGPFHSVTMVINNGSKPVLIQTPYSEIRHGAQVCNGNDNFILTAKGVILWR
ncbi:hypothetical protein [Geothrix sp. 21YS21S-2]|uniref:hypothetical protein n=1 Tax=Geothrix sp. 21YS21S-2 TaxID=3068893 RepID=UPI0027B8AA8D|nr:hypothetical protein [Geothrix sp. 21YS21S-2]